MDEVLTGGGCGGTRRGLLGTRRVGNRLTRIVKEVASDLPEAARREYRYFVRRRTSAVLVLTWGCTSRCKTCTAWRRPCRTGEELTLDEWLDVGGKLVQRGIRSVELFGGDVFLRKDVVVPLSRRLNSLGCKVRIPTNGNLLDERTARELADCLYVLYISIDGVDESHDDLRGRSGTFDRALNALEVMRRHRPSRGGAKLVCNTTVSRHNYRELPSIARFAAEAGFDAMYVEYVGEFTAEHAAHSAFRGIVPSPIYQRNGDSALVRADEVGELRRAVSEARRVGKSLAGRDGHFEVRTTNIDAVPDRDMVAGTVHYRRCFFERNTVIVDPYGNIVPCLFFDNIPLGNVRDGALEGSFDTALRAEFERCRDDGRLELCRHCIMAVVRNRTGSDVLKRAVATANASVSVAAASDVRG